MVVQLMVYCGGLLYVGKNYNEHTLTTITLTKLYQIISAYLTPAI